MHKGNDAAGRISTAPYCRSPVLWASAAWRAGLVREIGCRSGQSPRSRFPRIVATWLSGIRHPAPRNAPALTAL